MACGNNDVSRSNLSSQPKTAGGLRTNLNSQSNQSRSQKQLPKVADAFRQEAVSPDIGKKGGYLQYRSATGKVRDTRVVRIRDTRVVRIRQDDGTHRYISISEKVNSHGQITDVLAEDGIKNRIGWGRTSKDDKGVKQSDLADLSPKDRVGDHAHIAMQGADGEPGQRDTLGGLLGLLRDVEREDFQPELASLSVHAADFPERDGRPHGRPVDVHRLDARHE